MTHAEKRRSKARQEVENAVSSLRRAHLLLDNNGAIYAGAVAEQKARECRALSRHIAGEKPPAEYPDLVA